MKKKLSITIAVFLIVLFVAAVAICFSYRSSRVLILKINGAPLANLQGSYLAEGVGNAEVVQTTTDQDGRLDISKLPEEVQRIVLELKGRNDLGSVDISVPSGGTQTIDICGKRTITTRIRKYLFFFKTSEQEIWESH
jgi:hypothetical protein